MRRLNFRVFATRGIRAKLILAFLGLSLLIGICGASGLFFVQRIGASVSVFADVTSPMLGHTLQLVDNAQRTRAAFLDAMKGGGDGAKKLADAASDARQSIEALRNLSTRAELAVGIEAIESRQREFAQAFQAMLATHAREQATTAKTKALIEQFAAARRELDAKLAVIANESESKIVESEDRAKIEVQTGKATVEDLGELISQTLTETFPLLQGVNKLMRDGVKLEESTTAFVSATAPDDLGAIEKRAQSIFKTAIGSTKRIGSRMRTKEGKAQIAAMSDGLSKLEKLLLGDGGLFAAHREALAIHAETAGLQQGTAAREAGYIEALESARKLVGQRNDVAKTTAEQAVAQALPIIGAIVILGIMLAVLVGLVFANRIVGPLQRLTSAMTSLAEGALETAVPERGRSDEIGNMAAALQVFKDNAVETHRLVAEREREQGVKEQRGRRLADLCAEHEKSVTVLLDTLQRAAADMSVTSQTMSQVIGETGEQASAVVVAVDGASSNVQSVAAAAEELSSSVAGVNERIGHSAQIARKAADEAGRADEMVSALNGTATEIGDVLRMIQDIASQTNLLALNATIEAARAGEAGRGFAVVASEVKGLAGQTAKSAGEIAERISAIQNATSQVVGAIGGIKATINEMQEISDAVASTMDGQRSATEQIALNTQQVADATSEVRANVSGVSESVTTTGDAAIKVVEAAADLTEQARTLRSDIDRFLSEIRAA